MPAWPHPETPFHRRRSRSTFKVSLGATLADLERELDHLGARGIIIGAGLREEDIRDDGWPRAGARVPPFPGVEVSFDHPEHGRLVYATDVCEFWEHNVRSIALGLMSLRAVDRYGITRRGEQYAGWRALGPGVQARTMTIEDAWRTLGEAAGIDVLLVPTVGLTAQEIDRAELEVVWREAARRTHPDAGGDAETFVQAKAAHEFLTKALG